MSAEGAKELGLAGSEAERDRGSERVGDHVSRREPEGLDQGGEVILDERPRLPVVPAP